MTDNKNKSDIEQALITDQQIKSLGYERFINHGDYFIAVLPMTFGKGRIVYCDDIIFIENAWCYENYIDALLAMHQWDFLGTDEPSGWMRNPFDGRRRPDGDASKEYIYY